MAIGLAATATTTGAVATTTITTGVTATAAPCIRTARSAAAHPYVAPF